MSDSTSPSPTHQRISSLFPDPSAFIDIIANLLGPSECATIITKHQNLVPSHVTPTTVRDREVFDDAALATLLWERIGEWYERMRVFDEDGEGWVVEGLNERFRLCRYVPGGKFSPHFDGRRLSSVNEQSFMTINIYLSSLDSSGKGRTRFFSSPSNPTNPSLSDTSSTPVLQIPPVLGQAIVFRDNIWHDGEEVFEGVKYLLRTDVIFKREKDFEFERLYVGLGREERGRKALKIAEGLEDAGNSEEAVDWYRRAFREWPGLEGGG